MKRQSLLSVLTISSILTCSNLYAKNYKGEFGTELCYFDGYYVGLNAGFINHTMDITDINASSFLSTIQQVSNPKATGGILIGYRHQFVHDRVTSVYGAELSFNFASARYNEEFGSPFAMYQLQFDHRLNTVGLLQLLGGIAIDKTLLFIAGGLSWVDISGSVTNLDEIAFFNGFSVAKSMFGTAFGAGIEYAFCEKFSLRFKIDVIMPNTYTVSDNVDNKFEISNRIVQGTIGLNYKFA